MQVSVSDLPVSASDLPVSVSVSDLSGLDYNTDIDNNPLTYILTSAKLNATGHPERNNADADVLSRIPLNIDEYVAQCTREVYWSH